MKKWLVRAGIFIFLGCGLWLLTTINYTYEYAGISSLVSDQQEEGEKGNATNDGCDGWAMPIMMR